MKIIAILAGTVVFVFVVGLVWLGAGWILHRFTGEYRREKAGEE